MIERKHRQIAHEEEGFDPKIEEAIDDDLGDDLLPLLFVSCHPLLSPAARVALTLRLLGGLATDELARAFLVPEPPLAPRIVRATRHTSDATVPFAVARKSVVKGKMVSVRVALAGRRKLKKKNTHKH